jgi:C4-dicarboxylate-specific signal transduction histidine kinase
LDIRRIEEVEAYGAILSSHVQEKQWYDFILIADLDGNIVFSVNLEVLANIRDRRYFQASLRGEEFNSGIFYSDILDRRVMILSFPVRNRGGEIIGVLAAALNLGGFYDMLFDLRVGETSELFLVDGEGTLLSPTRLGAEPLRDVGFGPDETNPHTGTKGVKIHIDYRGQEVLSAHTRIPDTDFTLVSEIDLEEALRPVRLVNRSMLYVFLPLLVLVALLSNLHAKRTTAIVRKLTRDLETALDDSRTKRREVDAVNLELEEKVKESEILARELTLSERYIRNLIDSISLGVIGLDPGGRITHFNRQARDMVGGDELQTGHCLFDIPLWFDAPEVREAFAETLSTHRPQKLEQREIKRGDVMEYFNYFFFPIESADHAAAGTSLMIENFTERKRLREQLAEYEKLSALSQLALGAAHEINNPLLGISSYLEMLGEETEDPEVKREVGVVLENVSRISETIRGLLNFARPSPPQFTKVQVNQLIEETLSFLGHQPVFRRIEIKKSLSPSLPQITADLNQIRQVLINILLNAAQSMPKGGELRVGADKVKFQERIRIDISDTGEGIPPDHLKKIFKPFFTTKKS